jgi:hypothetical protein
MRRGCLCMFTDFTDVNFVAPIISSLDRIVMAVLILLFVIVNERFIPLDCCHVICL